MQRKKSSSELLSDSLIDLLERFPFEKVTVNQITENCGIAKRTFYNHFKDKYDLTLWTFTHKFEEYYLLNAAVSFSDLTHYCIEVVYKYRYMLRNIINYTGQNNFRQSILDPLVDLYSRVIKDKYGDDITDDLHSELFFYIGGQIAFAEASLTTGEVPTPEETFRIFCACIPESLKKYLH
ncbi:MAG: TetR family transcriptional regulator [Mogibacterium sp.]|nr:TetR family transcriptional regulator [Mogibacterium sp.]MBQ6315177.1 TetR family transcriptional regulator [Mogibacterium sp.]